MRKIILLLVLIVMICQCDKKENPMVGQTAYDFSLMNNNDSFGYV